ncbi:MAG: hypothetical protein ACTSRK_07105 [Promethearchaeota archaeon]
METEILKAGIKTGQIWFTEHFGGYLYFGFPTKTGSVIGPVYVDTKGNGFYLSNPVNPFDLCAIFHFEGQFSDEGGILVDTEIAELSELALSGGKVEIKLSSMFKVSSLDNSPISGGNSAIWFLLEY